MSSLYQRIAPGEQPESTPINIESRESLESEAAALPSKEDREECFEQNNLPAASNLFSRVIS
jgi:hypothetical protein